MTVTRDKNFRRVLNQLKKFGFLLESDPRLPSVATLITGSPLHSSWWSHPLAHTIFHVNGQLEDHPDVLVAKLVASKVTFIHRKLWPEILAIGNAREHWQTQPLSRSAHELLKLIEKKGHLQTDEIALTGSTKTKPGNVARELEKKLLVHATEVHTASGSHAKVLESWNHWVERIGFSAPSISADEAKKKLETRLGKLNAEFKATSRLPWEV